MKDQLTLTVEAVRDDQTEDQIKQIYAKTGAKRQSELIQMFLKCHQTLP
jgi:hypothetical protein